MSAKKDRGSECFSDGPDGRRVDDHIHGPMLDNPAADAEMMVDYLDRLRKLGMPRDIIESIASGMTPQATPFKRGGKVGSVESALRTAKKYASGGPLKEMSGLGDVSKHHQHDSGLIKSSIPGRTDKLPIAVRSGSYVVPADVVSSTMFGEGNSLAGGKTIDNLLAPHRKPKTGLYSGFGRNSRKSVKARLTGKVAAPKAEGGSVERIPIIAAGGEYVVEPEAVASMGGGDMDKGHDKFDKIVLKARRHNIRALKALPGPKKN